MTIHRTDAMPTPESDEQYVREVLDSAMSHTHPPRDLASLALARGRRLRSRRRTTLAATALAASVLAVATVPFVLGGSGSESTGGDVVATQPPAPEPGLTETPPGWWDMPAAQMVDRLAQMLPTGVVLTEAGPLTADTEEGGPAHGSINPTLGTSAGGELVSGDVTIMLWPMRTIPVALEGVGPDEATFEVGGRAEWLTCPGNLGASTSSCTVIRSGDGDPVGRRSITVMGGVTVFEVVLTSGDGVVYGAVANTEDDTWSADSPVTAPRPPLTMAQLEAVVRNEAWTSYGP